MPEQEQPTPVSQWFDYAKQLPADAPDTLYDAQREKFFRESVMPWAMKQGFAESETRQQFMKNSERPGRSTFPRAAVVGTTALQSLTAPITGSGLGGLKGIGEGISAAKEAAVRESQKQGISTVLPEMAGTAIGEAPYWIAGLEGARGAVGAVKAATTLPAAMLSEATVGIDRAAQIAAGALVQGSYDAAKNTDGRAITEGLKGAAVGGATVGAFELAGPLWRMLTGSGVKKEAAQAIEKVVKGVATPEEEAVAAKATQAAPEITDQIKKWVGAQAQAAKRQGVPTTPPEVEYNGAVRITMKGPDGKYYSSGGRAGLDPKNMQDAVDKINKWLDKGAEIYSIKGDPTAQHAFLKQLEKIKDQAGDLTPDIELSAKPASPSLEELTQQRDQLLAEQATLKKGEVELGSPPTQTPSPLPETRQPETRIVLKPEKKDAPPSPEQQELRIRGEADQLAQQGHDVEDVTMFLDQEPKLLDFAQRELDKVKVKAAKRAEGFKTPLSEGGDLPMPREDFLGELERVIKDPKTTTEVKMRAEIKLSKIAPDRMEALSVEENNRIENSLYETEAPKKPKAKAEKITAADIDPLSRFTVRWDGKVKDEVTNQVFVDMQAAMKSVGVEARPDPGNAKFATKEQLKWAEANHGRGAWFNQDGSVQMLKPTEWHEEGDLEAIANRVVTKGDVRVRKDAVNFSDKSSYSSIVRAAKMAMDQSKDNTIRVVYKTKENGLMAVIDKQSLEDFIVEPEKWMQQNSKMKSGRFSTATPLDTTINQRDSLLHFTNEDNAIGILKDRKFTVPEDAEEGNSSLQGISTTRMPHAGKDFGPVTFVLDKSKLKTVSHVAEDSYSPGGAAYRFGKVVTPEMAKAYEVQNLMPGQPSKWFEAEERIKGLQGMDLSSVRGIIINKQAVEDPDIIKQLKILAKANDIPVKILQTSEELAYYRAGLSRLPEGQRFSPAQGASTIPGATEGTVERPLGERTVLSQPEPWMQAGPGVDAAGMSYAAEGMKPQIYYMRDALNRGVIFHENLHGHIGYLGLSDTLEADARDQMGKKLLGAYAPNVANAYKRRNSWGEEVFVQLAQDIRTGNQNNIQKFVDADESREKVMGWATDKALNTLFEVVQKNDSLHKRVMERKLRDVIKRAGGIADLEGDARAFNHDLFFQDDKWHLVDSKGDVTHTFDDRAGLVDHLQTFQEPLTAPELVDYSGMPEGMLRFSTRDPMAAGSGTPPIQSDVPPSQPIKGGMLPFSFFFRPREQWMEEVARKSGWNELYDTYREATDQHLQMTHFIQDWQKKLKAAMGDATNDSDLRRNLGAFRHAKSTDKAAVELNLTPDQIAISHRITKDITDPLFQEFGIGDTAKYVEEYLPRLREQGWDPDKVVPTGTLTPKEIKFWAELNRVGNLDPRDQDIGRILDTYIQAGARKKFLEDPLKKLASLNDLKTEEGHYVTGNLQPLIKRVVENFRNQPDYTYNVINGVMNAGLDALKEQVARMNKFLPEKLQIEALDNVEGKDVLNKWTMFMYAGALGLRPMTYIRDGMQILMTTYPILGGKYLMKGMKLVFNGAKEGKEGEIWQIPRKYGAVYEESPLQDLYSSGFGASEATAMTKISKTMLKPMQWSNNSNRLVAFWGHQMKAFEALNSAGSPEEAIKESGAHWLPELLKQKYLKEVQAGDPSKWEDLSYRISKDLVDMTQWNYTKGASPGLYKYAAGRLFGMYGTWPMSYLEYARMILSKGDRNERLTAGARLMAAHSAVLASGQAAGIDTGTWVFTQPATFGGSPIYNSIVNIPGSLDFETYKGQEARRALVSPVFPLSIPGGLAAQQLLKAISTNDPDTWKIIMGFKPMKPSEYDKGLHQLLPRD